MSYDIINPLPQGHFECLISPVPEYKLIVYDDQMRPIPLPDKIYDITGQLVSIQTVYQMLSNNEGIIDFNMTLDPGVYYVEVIPTNIYQTLQLEQSINYAEITTT